MALDTYTDSPLREKGRVRYDLTLDDESDNSIYWVKEEGSKEDAVKQRIETDPQNGFALQAWLNLSDVEVRAKAAEAGVRFEDVACVSVPVYQEADGTILHSQIRRHLQFGFYREKP